MTKWKSSPKHIIIILNICLVLGLFTVTAFPVVEPGAALFSDAAIESKAAREPEPQVIRQRLVAVNFERLCQLEQSADRQKVLLPRLGLNLFEDAEFYARFYQVETVFSGGYSFIGEIEGIPGSSVTLVVTGEIVSANISVPGHFYQVRYAAEGAYKVQEVEHSGFPVELNPIPVQLEEITAPDSIAPDSGNYIDVMVVYTAAARSGAGGTAAMENLIDLAVSETNTGYSNSGVTQRIRLVHTAEVDYSETSFNWSTTLSRLRITTDGYMDDVHTWRDTYGADEVVLIVNDTASCGIAYVMQTVSTSFASYAFAVVSRTCASGYYSFAHEMGHNMGSAHDRANGSVVGAYDYSYGYQAPDEAFRTIMAYNCPGGCPRVNYWSNPAKQYGGQPMGVVYTDPLAADNHKSLNNTAYTVANFRQAAAAPTITVTSPNGGETLTAGSSHNITWTYTGTVGNVKIEYSSNNGSSWSTVVSATANDGSYAWTVPSVNSSSCKVKISEASDGSPSDTGNAVFSITSSSTPTITVTSPNGGETLTAGSSHNITWTYTGTVGNVKIEYSSNNGSSWSTVISTTANDGSYAWTVPGVNSSSCKVKISEASDGSPSDTSDAMFTIYTPTPPGIVLNRSKLVFGANTSGTKTGNQFILVENIGGGTLEWDISGTPSWLQVSPASGTDSTVITVAANPAGMGLGTYTGTLRVSAPEASNSPQDVAVTLKVYQAGTTSGPFGEFATPAANSTVRSSIPVTGWVLDDIEVISVKIYNGSDYVGDALLVEGARPDVELAYAGRPKSYQAGWGYMMLTNFLPNGGNGTYTLFAKATDAEGNRLTLGSKTITCDNANAKKPFGAIDTPGQGGTASGNNFVNWGWVLTPQPNRIPTDGSTINVYVDGVYLGHPRYNIYRSDIATFFPGYANSDGAVGYFYLDTSAHKNGTHTIQWTTVDNAGNTDGIGSRYFAIQNTGSDATQSQAATSMPVEPRPQFLDELSSLTLEIMEPVRLEKGCAANPNPAEIHPDENGNINIKGRELERTVIYLGSVPGFYSGFLVVGEELRPLPAGSVFDAARGIFYWGPGPGFAGNYEFVFVDRFRNLLRKVNINILPKY